MTRLRAIRDVGAARRRLVGLVGALRNKLLVAAGLGGALQPSADDFWRRSTTTYLATAAYYNRREEVLKEVLDSLPRLDSALDVGCGDGRFTCILAAHARRVEGYDLAPALVEQARCRGRELGLTDFAIGVCDLDHLPTERTHDLVSCMGVTSCVVEEAKYLRLLDTLRDLTRPGGHLLLVDSLTSDRERISAYRSGYVARYRSIDAYLDQLARRGFTLERRLVVQEWPGVTNQLFLLARGEAAARGGEPMRLRQ